MPVAPNPVVWTLAVLVSTWAFAALAQSAPPPVAAPPAAGAEPGPPAQPGAAAPVAGASDAQPPAGQSPAAPPAGQSPGQAPAVGQSPAAPPAGQAPSAGQSPAAPPAGQAPAAAPASRPTSPVMAPPPPPDAPHEVPSPVRIVLGAGMHEGLLAGASFDAADFVLRVSGGYYPILIGIDNDADAADDDGRLIGSGQLNADAIWMFARPLPRSRIGVSVGYRYNSVMAHGVGLAFQGEARLSEVLSIGYTAGLYIFPEGDDRIDAEIPEPESNWRANTLPVHENVQAGAGVSLVVDL